MPSDRSVEVAQCNPPTVNSRAHAAGSAPEDAGSWPVLSLFSGAGGLDRGFKQAGFSPRLAIDVDAAAVATYRWNEPHTKVVPIDIADCNPSELVDLWMSVSGETGPLGIIGGPPCQAFSVSNVFQRRTDPRRRLLGSYAAVIREFTSRLGLDFFVFENVPGILHRRHRRRYMDFKRECRRAGFNVRERLVDAGRFGIPQTRKRVIVIGTNEERFPGLDLEPPSGDKQPSSVRFAIEGLPEPAFCRKRLDPTEIPYHPNHVAMVPRSKKFTNGMLVPGDCRGRSFRVLRWDKPSYTVAYGHREVHVHPDLHRRLSIYEAMRLQGFPHSYELKGTFSQQVQLVSDALPPPLGEGIAETISRGLGYASELDAPDAYATG